MIETLFSTLLFLGSLFIFIASLGVLKFQNALMRAHALSKALTLGISLILLGLIPFLETYAEGMKIFLAIAFLFATIPIAGHIFALYAAARK